VVAENVSSAVDVPWFAFVTVNAVLPHPLVDGVATTPNSQLGRRILIVSGPAVSRGAFKLKMKVTAVLAAVTGLSMSSLLMRNAGACSWSDCMMGVSPMLLMSAREICTVREAKLAAWAEADVVTPDPTVTAHTAPIANVAAFAVSFKVAATLPESVNAGVNPVLPQPDVETEPGAAIVKLGNTMEITSFTTMGTLSLNRYVTVEGAAVTGLPSISTLCRNFGNSGMICVDVWIEVGTALAALAKFTATVRIARLALTSGETLVVTPALMARLHRTFASMVAVAAVNVILAVAIPVFAPAALKVVVPHPLDTRTVGDPVRVNIGNTNTTESVPDARGVFNVNVNEMDDGVAGMGLAMTKMLCVTAVVATTDEASKATATTLSEAAKVAATVRDASFKPCGTELVVTPVATLIIHCVRGTNVAVAAVNVRVAVALPELAPAAVKLVVPHPVSTGVARVPKTNWGKSMARVSPTASGAFNAKKKRTADVAVVTGFDSTNRLKINADAGATT
jgi:hypothetical protein